MKETKLYHSSSAGQTIYDRAIAYLNKKYNIRYNSIALEYEIQLRENLKNWEILNINSLLIELSQSGVEIALTKLEILLRSHSIPQYNPLEEYFENLPEWDNFDIIGMLASYISTDNDPLFRYHLEKWLTRAVLCVFKKGYINKQYIVLTSEQNTGKSFFLRFLTPPELLPYYTENISVDKDGIIAICKNLICNLDELAVLSKADINTLKSFISKSSVNVRLPYGRKAELLERICSFVGSTNRTDFLTDETGSVRWLVFEVTKINFAYTSEIDINKVWSQAYFNAFKRKNYDSELTVEDIEINERRNEKYSTISLEEEIVNKYFEKSENVEDFLTASDVMLIVNTNLRVKLNIIKIGKVLTRQKYKRIKHPQKQTYGYLISKKIEIM